MRAFISNDDNLIQAEITKAEMTLNDSSADYIDKFNAAREQAIFKLRQIKNREQRKQELERAQNESAMILAQEIAENSLKNMFESKGSAAGRMLAKLIDEIAKEIVKETLNN